MSESFVTDPVPVKGDNPFVAIRPNNGGIIIDYGLRIYYKHKAKGGLLCYVSGWDIYFNSPNIEDARKKAGAMTKFYMDNFFIHKPKNGLKYFVLELHKLGFKATKNNTATIHSLINNKPIKAKFNNSVILPEGFSNASSISEEANMLVEAV